MSAKKRALGRGLDSLIAPSMDESNSSKTSDKRLFDIAIESIRPNLNQPRFQFSDEELAELAHSIEEKGVLQPLLVRRKDDHYELIAGERRLRASQSIGKVEVPCLVVQVSDEESLEIALIENLQRENLNPMEEARAFRSLMDQFGLSAEQVGKHVGKSRSAIANSVRLLKLPLDIQEDVLEKRLSAGHARAILSVPQPQKQRQLRNLIITRGLSVRETERQAQVMVAGKKAKPPKPHKMEIHMRSLQENFTLKIGLRVLIKPVTKTSGRIEIHYHSLDDFETITEYFGVEKQ